MYPDFRAAEFACRCENEACQRHGMQFIFLSALQDLRSQIAIPFKINSGFRCKTYNSTLAHSAADSYHCKGLAADISTHGMPGKVKHKFLEKAFDRFTGIGVYRNFVHLDLRDVSLKTCWVAPAGD